MVQRKRATPKATPRKRDRRPPIAIGHVEHRVTDVAAAADWYEALGVRGIVRRRDFAVLEVRGGTHMIIAKASKPVRRGTTAPLDFMVNDLDATHRACLKRGMNPTPIARGTIHDRFEVVDPSGYTLTILSSHASDLPV